MSRKYFIETYGCQMNYHDSEQMAGLLDAAGFDRTSDDGDADVVVINTCSVREHAEDKLYTRLGELRVQAHDSGRDPMVVVTGCVAQQEGESLLKRSSMVDVVVGTRRLRMLPVLVEQAARTHLAQVDLGAHDNVAFPFGVTRRDDPVRAWVTIIEGCNEYCSFCVVPYTRGHERMRPKAEILAEVRDAAARGLREVQLLGQIVNHYQAPDDPSCDFAALLEAVHEVEGLARIRFASPHPRHVTPRLIAAIRDLPKVCKHLHLPVQSGSSRCSSRCGVATRATSYLALVDQLGPTCPDRAEHRHDRRLSGETTADFDDTISLRPASAFTACSRSSTRSARTPSRPSATATMSPRRRRHGGSSAAGAAARRAAGDCMRRWSADRARACRCRQPPARDGVVGPHDREHGGEFPRRGLTYRHAGAGRHSSRRTRTASGARWSRPMQIEMTIKGLMVDPVTNMPIIILRDEAGDRVLPIWVGIFEANAIALQIENVATPRPMTHDLLRNVIQDLDGTVQKVVVSELKENTFFAVIHLVVRGEAVLIDARPSDAIALALRTKAPIYVEEDVIDNAKALDGTPERTDSERLQKWLESLDSDDLGKYKM